MDEPMSMFGLRMAECDRKTEERRQEKRRSWHEPAERLERIAADVSMETLR